MTRLFRRGELKAALLNVLAETGPAHGYAIIGTLAGRVGEGWRPSPGAVYPALLALEDDRLIAGQEHGGSRVYELTPEGRRALDAAGQVLDDVAERARRGPTARPTLGAALDDFARHAPGRTHRLEPHESEAVEAHLRRLTDDLNHLLTTRST